LAQGLYDISLLEPLIEEGYTLLTPNFRLARRLKAEWNTRCMSGGELVWEPLSVQPLENWLQGQWELAVNLDLLPPTTPLRPNQALELWRQVICEQEGESEEYHLLRPAAAAEIAGRARDTLKRWQIDMNDRGLRQTFMLDPDCGTFLKWLALFDQRLHEAGQCTPVDCLTQLLAVAGQLPSSKVALVELEDIAPLERALLESLRVEVQKLAPKKNRAQRLVHACSDQRAELRVIAQWAASLHRADSATTVGIVLSGSGGDRASLEYLLRREFDCLGENYNSLPVNFSTGIPLAQTPLVRDGLAALAMGLQHTTVPAVVRLMHSRFVNLPDAQSALSHRFTSSLYKRGAETLTIADLRYAASNVRLAARQGLVLGRYLTAVSEMKGLRRPALPSLWVERFREILSVWGWPGNQVLDSLEYQQWELWNQTLEEFKAYDSVCKTLAYGEALQLMQDCCHRQISQPQTEDSPIQVLGPLEAVGLEFDHLWLAGMQGTSWPASPRPNPFIPVALQAQRLMPHATPEREWVFSEALLKQYASACKILHASFYRQIDGVPELPSALLEHFVAETLAEPPPVAAQWKSIYSQYALEQLHDSKAPDLDLAAQSAITGGSGLLEDQSQCPFRAFARHRLQVEPLASFTVALSAGERGSLLHDALCALWGELGDHASLAALTQVEQGLAVKQAVQAAIDGVPQSQRRKVGKAYWTLEGQRLETLLNEWLDVERQRDPFVVIQREEDITLVLAQIEVRLRVDRIDQLPDGSRVIIDYKSGKSKIQDWLSDRPAKPQLLLYAIAEPETAAALAFAQIRPRDCRYVGLGRVAAAPGISTDISRTLKSDMDAKDWASLNEQWQENLERLAHEFIAGKADVDPLGSSSCTWCGLQPLCRVDFQSETAEVERL
jgi:probable DNA repair protein